MDHSNIQTCVTIPPDQSRLTLLAGASAQPFADVFWDGTKHDSETALGLLNLLSHLQEGKQYGQLFQLLRILFGAFGLRFGAPILALKDEPAALACFLDCFVRDFYEIIDDHVAGFY